MLHGLLGLCTDVVERVDFDFTTQELALMDCHRHDRDSAHIQAGETAAETRHELANR